MNKSAILKTGVFKWITQTRLYRNIGYRRFAKERMGWIYEEAMAKFDSLGKNDLREKYKSCFPEALVSFSEFMYQYEFWKLSKEEQREFVSRLELRLWYQRNNPKYLHPLFWNKGNWLRRFNRFVKRRWIDLDQLSYADFLKWVSGGKEFIAKPSEGSLGAGIFKFTPTEISREWFDELREQKYIIEDCVYNVDSIGSFHPQSLNTIRVTTIGASGDILGSFFRVGKGGNIIDNAHAGGIFITVNPETGCLIGDGIDTDGNSYSCHPDTGKKFNGFCLPYWDDIVRLVKELHSEVPDAPIIGWDIAVTSNGIDVIEGNHLPDFDVLQSPQKIGIRAKVNNMLKKGGFPIVE